MTEIKLERFGTVHGQVFRSNEQIYLRLNTTSSCCWYEATEDGYIWTGMEKSQLLNYEFQRMSLAQAAAKNSPLNKDFDYTKYEEDR